MQDRAINLDGYGISRAQYQELRGFALQYPERRKKLNEGNITPEYRAKLAEENALIERTAKDTTEGQPHLTAIILQAATDSRYKFYISEEQGETPCAKNTFIRYRRRFYYLLALRRGMIE